MHSILIHYVCKAHFHWLWRQKLRIFIGFDVKNCSIKIIAFMLRDQRQLVKRIFIGFDVKNCSIKIIAFMLRDQRQLHFLREDWVREPPPLNLPLCSWVQKFSWIVENFWSNYLILVVILTKPITQTSLKARCWKPPGRCLCITEPGRPDCVISIEIGVNGDAYPVAISPKVTKNLPVSFYSPTSGFKGVN